MPQCRNLPSSHFIFFLSAPTVNTTARIESSGAPNRIHVSAETAQFLTTAGKMHWLEARKDAVTAKGKGELKTFWLDFKSSKSSSVHSGSSERSGEDLSAALSDENKPHVDGSLGEVLDDKTRRLVEWNTDVLARLLRQIVARRSVSLDRKARAPSSCAPTMIQSLPGKTVSDEVQEIIELPEFDATAVRNQQDPDTIQLDPIIVTQLRDLVTSLANMYQANPFHSFEHASHVTMSVVK